VTAAEKLRALAEWCERHGVQHIYTAHISPNEISVPFDEISVPFDEFHRLAPDAVPGAWVDHGPDESRHYRAKVDGVELLAAELRTKRGAR
jgi:hypothetical protein